MVDYSDRNVYGSGVASLIGDGGISLDGQSVQLPDDGAYDMQDDISSINESSVYRNDLPQIKIVGTAEDLEGGITDLETPASMALSNNPGVEVMAPNLKDNDNTLSTTIPISVGELPKKAPNMKNTSKLSVDGKKRRRCLPTWVSEAPSWLKCVIVVSLALLVGAVALVSVALTTAISEQEEASQIATASNAENATPQNPQVTVPISPAPSTLIVPESDTTDPPSASESHVSSPTAAPMQSTPSGQTASSNTTAPTFLPDSTPVVVVTSTSTPTAQATPLTTDGAAATTVTDPSPTVTPELVAATDEGTTTEEEQIQEEDPYDPLVTTFFVTGGRFTNDALAMVPDQLTTLPTRGGTSFMVHLGDWNSPYATRCDRQSYQHVNNLFSNSSIPVYFIPGDNDFNDCPNPEQALSLWHEYLQDYETQYWDAPSKWTIERDIKNDYPENFAFVYNEILFVGINLVGGVVHNATEWETRQASNLIWIEENYQLHKDSIQAFVLFAHADPDVPSNSPFYEPFKERVKKEYNQIPVVLIHRNLGVEPWSWETEFENINNLSVVVVAGSVWPPLMGAVDFRQKNPFIFDQSNWYDDYIEHRSSAVSSSSRSGGRMLL
ncbi:expressed unknown protein [Seminavis robusta]|uniref:Calcineurin-like phosphoesterase domain-containing protein n=1 Tax=Seminavis robusta TaxID=568900 RepID=A0A9N8EPA2_9STRA|nr:expressed unknown protein [Seminavis robusta]|eukprot:Sro1440_g272890.1 n/a (610) ;mRNA; r:16102-18036